MAGVIDVPVGHECKLYQWAGPRVDFATDNGSFVEVGITGDLDMPEDRDMFEVDIRAMGGDMAEVPTRRDKHFTCQILHAIDDASFTAIEDAFNDGTTLSMCIMTGAKDASGARYVYGDYHVKKFGAPQNIAEGLIHAAEFRVAPSTLAVVAGKVA